MRKTNDYEPSKALKFIKDHKKIISIIVVLIYMLSIGVVFWKYNGDLEKVYFISQIISGGFVVGGLVVSVLQYTASCVDNAILRDQEKKIKAAEMANKFQSEMIPLLNLLAGAYRCSSQDGSVLKKIESTKLSMFDKEEVNKVLSEIGTEQSNILTGLYIGHLLDTGRISKKDIDIEHNEINVSDENKKAAEQEVNVCINDLSNKLEYFGIYFNSGIADEDTVYQSLHKVFFQCVHMLYPFIFANNTSESDRLFENMSSLYISWKERYNSLVERENEELINRKKDVHQKIIVKAKKARH